MFHLHDFPVSPLVESPLVDVGEDSLHLASYRSESMERSPMPSWTARAMSPASMSTWMLSAEASVASVGCCGAQFLSVNPTME